MHRFWYANSDLDGADHYLPNIPQGREAIDFVTCTWTYCNAIGFFVLPIMVFQLLEVSSACFTADNLAWVKLLAVLGACGSPFSYQHLVIATYRKESHACD